MIYPGKGLLGNQQWTSTGKTMFPNPPRLMVIKVESSNLMSSLVLGKIARWVGRVNNSWSQVKGQRQPWTGLGSFFFPLIRWDDFLGQLDNMLRVIAPTCSHSLFALDFIDCKRAMHSTIMVEKTKMRDPCHDCNTACKWLESSYFRMARKEERNWFFLLKIACTFPR